MVGRVDRGSSTLRFRDLGNLIVERDDEPRSLGPLLAAALAMLLIEVNRPVSAETLAAGVWGDRAKIRSKSTLESHVWRLRRAVEPGRDRGAAPSVLVNDARGYRLVAAVDQVDSLAFRGLADESADLLAEGRTRRALRRIDEALGLWRGRPYLEVADTLWAAPAVAKLTELHTQLVERRVDALLAVDEPERALVALGPVLAALPLRERPWEQLMLAEYRLGRVDAALATHRRVHALFRDQLGLEPAGQLRALQARVLAGDPALHTSTGQDRRPRPRVEIHLPGPSRRLIGRADELAHIAALVGRHPLVTVTGPAGCGKTVLAVEVGRAVAAGFLDGVTFVDLTVAAEDGQVGAAVASALGLAVATATVEEALRALARGRLLLLVLDNCEHVLDGVRALLREVLVAGSELTVLATSREPLGLDGERVWPLGPLRLPGPDEAAPAQAPAVQLFVERATAADPAVRLDVEGLRVAARICAAVDGLPLAIELAAARARAYSLDEIATQVDADPSTLARLGRGQHHHHDTVRAAVEWSHRLLPPDEQFLHRHLSVVPGPFTVAVAEALDRRAPGPDATPTGDLVAGLVHRSLLVPLGPAGPGRPSRFVQLATVRGHGAHALDRRAEAPTAADRRDQWVAQLVAARPLLGREERRWQADVDDDLAAVRAAVRHTLLEHPSPLGVQLAGRLRYYWFNRGMLVEGRQWIERANAIADRADVADRVVARLALGMVLAFEKRREAARGVVDAAVAEALAVPPDRAAAVAGEFALTAGAAWLCDDTRLVTALTRQVAELAVSSGDDDTAVLARAVAPMGEGAVDPPERAVKTADAVYADAVAMGNHFAAWLSAGTAIGPSVRAGDLAGALRWSDRMLERQRWLGMAESPVPLEMRANVVMLSGDVPSAVRLYGAARAHQRRAGMVWPSRPETVGLLVRAEAALGADSFDLLWRTGSGLTLADPTPADDDPAAAVVLVQRRDGDVGADLERARRE